MALSMSATKLLTIAISIRIASARSGPTTTKQSTLTTSSIPASASVSASAVKSSSGDYTTVVIPVNLYNAIDPLLAQCFPSPTPCGLPAITWPSTLEFGSITYDLQSKTTSTDSTAPAKSTKHSGTVTSDPSHLSSTPSLTSSTTGDENSGQKNDETLAIIFGVILGVVALAVLAVLIFCLLRRRKKAGSFFLHRSTPSPTSVRSRALNAFGTTLYVSSGTLHVSNGSSSRPNMSPTNQDDTPSLLRPGPVHRESSRSRSDDNAFYTPLEQPAAAVSHHELEGRRVEQKYWVNNPENIRQRSLSSNQSTEPPAPFSPVVTQQPQATGQDPPLSPLDPFAVGESDDVVSPILPSKSFERRNSPMIHYPSMDEVNDFDFYGQGKDRVSVDSIGGWHPSKQRYDGRHELP